MSTKKGHGEETVEVLQEVAKSEVALREEAMLRFWRDNDVFQKTLDTPAGEAPVGDFVFYDGPPFATGLPHYGHILAGTIKDAIPRFWTMNGYRVPRKWGWDCHGLPLENLIEKELGLGTKRDIEEYGVKNFNEKARGAVMRYADDWREIIPRMGRFVDMADDYKTMDSTYTESVWWVFKSLHEKGLVFEGFKTMHLCPRCGTTLSNFEVNQGYKDIKDIAVTVKLPLLDDVGNVTDTSLLVWTTTPWTLPGNMAAAVHKDGEYVIARVEKKMLANNEPQVADKSEWVVVAKKNAEQLYFEASDYMVHELKTIKGSDLVGRKYQPPFDYVQKQNLEGADKAWTIYHADYVELGEEGTGAVHIAPAYGEDDMQLGQKHGVPIVHHVDEAGRFKDFVTDFAGRLVKPKDDEVSGVDHKDTDIEILRALQQAGKIFKKENISHSYPHCWRCETPLLNYATTSWFVNVPKIKDQLIEANKSVNWVPDHVGQNRFGKWLEGARDWAVSRQRYWGAPLPVWRNPVTKSYKVFGSVAELAELVPASGNRYHVMRHAEAQSNVEGFLNGDTTKNNPLTEKGLQQIKDATIGLAGDIDYIFYSPLPRTKQTAELVAEALGLPSSVLIEDVRLRESGMGGLEGRPNQEKVQYYSSPLEEFTKSVAGLETLNEVKVRMGDFLYDIEKKYQGKKILIVSHGDPLTMLQAAVSGRTTEESLELFKTYINNAEVREINFRPLPHNDTYELDLHRPYIDDIELFDGEVKLERIPDVFDCWFESGAMPYGQQHFMGEDFDEFIKTSYPAQFVSESIDQTRGWFYSMTVLGVALFGKSPFENVVTNGLVLAEDGRKMSKSLQNYPDPMDLVSRIGADAMRFYLLSSSIIKGEDLNFSEKEVTELQRKNIGRLHNVLAMYEMFQDGTKGSADSQHVLDRWILARLQELVNDSTAGYKNYELDKATRPVSDFIDDLSVWYLRRSRDRFKGVRQFGGMSQEVASDSDVRKNSDNLNSSCKEDVDDKALALATLRHTLQTLSLVMAPAMPFYAEYLWQAVKEEGDAESVHLGKWPEEEVVDIELLQNMTKAREIVTFALEARTHSKINVRQPIQSISGPEISTDLAKIILEEVNAKNYLGKEMKTKGMIIVSIDSNITPELKSEGNVRELMRAVQGRRKTEGLAPTDAIALTVSTSESGEAAIEANRDMLVKTVGASELIFTDTDGEVVATDTEQFIFTITKQ